MRPLPALLLTVLTPAVLAAQAPPGADLWRVVALANPVPAALTDGPAGQFWNPGAPAMSGRFAVGVQVVNTSHVLGLSGLLVAASHEVGVGLRVGVLAGRMQMRDLVRTTTSPAREGTIPVYEQVAGVSAGMAWPGVCAGVLIRLHDDRFDVLREQGLTLDAGVSVRPLPRIRLAAASHFLPLTLGVEPTTDLLAGAEILVAEGLPVGLGSGRITLRYGVAYQPEGGHIEHSMGGGLGLAELLQVDAIVIREVGLTGSRWRPVVGVGLRVGRYTLTAARGNGLNDVGATYRIGLDVDFAP